MRSSKSTGAFESSRPVPVACSQTMSSSTLSPNSSAPTSGGRLSTTTPRHQSSALTRSRHQADNMPASQRGLANSCGQTSKDRGSPSACSANDGGTATATGRIQLPPRQTSSVKVAMTSLSRDQHQQPQQLLQDAVSQQSVMIAAGTESGAMLSDKPQPIAHPSGRNEVLEHLSLSNSSVLDTLHPEPQAHRLSTDTSLAGETHHVSAPSSERLNSSLNSAEKSTKSAAVDVYSPPPPPPPPIPPPPPQLPDYRSPFPSRFNSTDSSDVQQSRAQTKRLQWEKIPAYRVQNVTAKGHQTVWNVIGNMFGRKTGANDDEKRCVSGSLDLDFNSLEQLFAIQASPSTMATGSSDIAGELTSSADSQTSRGGTACSLYDSVGFLTLERRRKSEEILVLDSQRSMNVNIFLRQFGSGSTQSTVDIGVDIARWLRQGYSQHIGPERLRNLLKILPEADDIDLLKQYVNSDKRLKLGVAEKFYVELMSVPHCKFLVEALLTKEELQMNVDSIKPAIKAMILTAHGIKSNKALHQILHMVLVVGNFLNKGAYSGEAAGFRLDSLLKLSDLRASKPGMNLMHYVAMEVERLNPNIVEELNKLRYINDAAQCSIDEVTDEVQSLERRINDINENSQLPDELFQRQMEPFLQHAASELSTLAVDIRVLDRLRIELAAYFCEDEKTFRLDRCLSTLNTFCQRFHKAIDENHERRVHDEQAEQRRRFREQQTLRKSKLASTGPFVTDASLSPSTAFVQCLGVDKSRLQGNGLDFLSICQSPQITCSDSEDLPFSCGNSPRSPRRSIVHQQSNVSTADDSTDGEVRDLEDVLLRQSTFKQSHVGVDSSPRFRRRRRQGLKVEMLSDSRERNSQSTTSLHTTGSPRLSTSRSPSTSSPSTIQTDSLRPFFAYSNGRLSSTDCRKDVSSDNLADQTSEGLKLENFHDSGCRETEVKQRTNSKPQDSERALEENSRSSGSNESENTKRSSAHEIVSNESTRRSTVERNDAWSQNLSDASCRGKTNIEGDLKGLGRRGSSEQQQRSKNFDHLPGSRVKLSSRARSQKATSAADNVSTSASGQQENMAAWSLDEFSAAIDCSSVDEFLSVCESGKQLDATVQTGSNFPKCSSHSDTQSKTKSSSQTEGIKRSSPAPPLIFIQSSSMDVPQDDENGVTQENGEWNSAWSDSVQKLKDRFHRLSEMYSESELDDAFHLSRNCKPRTATADPTITLLSKTTTKAADNSSPLASVAAEVMENGSDSEDDGFQSCESVLLTPRCDQTTSQQTRVSDEAATDASYSENVGQAVRSVSPLMISELSDSSDDQITVPRNSQSQRQSASITDSRSQGSLHHQRQRGRLSAASPAAAAAKKNVAVHSRTLSSGLNVSSSSSFPADVDATMTKKAPPRAATPRYSRPAAENALQLTPASTAAHRQWTKSPPSSTRNNKACPQPIERNRRRSNAALVDLMTNLTKESSVAAKPTLAATAAGRRHSTAPSATAAVELQSPKGRGTVKCDSAAPTNSTNSAESAAVAATATKRRLAAKTGSAGQSCVARTSSRQTVGQQNRHHQTMVEKIEPVLKSTFTASVRRLSLSITSKLSARPATTAAGKNLSTLRNAKA